MLIASRCSYGRKLCIPFHSAFVQPGQCYTPGLAGGCVTARQRHLSQVSNPLEVMIIGEKEFSSPNGPICTITGAIEGHPDHRLCLLSVHYPPYRQQYGRDGVGHRKLAVLLAEHVLGRNGLPGSWDADRKQSPQDGCGITARSGQSRLRRIAAFRSFLNRRCDGLERHIVPAPGKRYFSIPGQ